MHQQRSAIIRAFGLPCFRVAFSPSPSSSLRPVHELLSRAERAHIAHGTISGPGTHYFQGCISPPRASSTAASTPRSSGKSTPPSPLGERVRRQCVDGDRIPSRHVRDPPTARAPTVSATRHVARTGGGASGFHARGAGEGCRDGGEARSRRGKGGMRRLGGRMRGGWKAMSSPPCSVSVSCRIWGGVRRRRRRRCSKGGRWRRTGLLAGGRADGEWVGSLSFRVRDE